MVKYERIAQIFSRGDGSKGVLVKTEGNAARFEITSTSIVAALASSIAAAGAAALSVVASECLASWIALAFALVAVSCILYDIAPRRPRPMRAIGRRESAELCRLFIEHSPVYIFFKDARLKHLLLSRNFEAATGKPLEEMLGRGAEAMFGPEFAERLDAEDREALRGGKPVDIMREAGGYAFRVLEFPIMRKGKPAYLAGFSIDVTDQKKAEERALRSVREKDELIRELYHRTKNTLQVIRSMLELQVEEYPESDSARRLVRDAEDRIQAMALVHQMLYESRDVSHIFIKDYVTELASLVYRSFGASEERIALDLDIADQSISLETAIPIGLILNELLTNSMKHAFPNRRGGRIGIGLAVGEAGSCLLRYADDGIGVPPGFDFYERESLGLKLIRSIGAQIGAEVLFESDGGVACSISFSIGEGRAREPTGRAAVQA